MSIWVNSETKVVVQGITGKEGRFHSEKCREYGTKIVAGVTPGKAGQDVDGVPVFNTVEDAVSETGANASLIFVPPPFAADAILEAADAGIEVIVAVSAPTTLAVEFAKSSGVTLVGFARPGRHNVYTFRDRIVDGD